MVHVTIEDASLEGNTEFECVMNVPDTSYTEKRVIMYSYGECFRALGVHYVLECSVLGVEMT